MDTRGSPTGILRDHLEEISSRICLEILRSPPTRLLTLQSRVQYSWKPARCHRTTVSGRTSTSASFH